MKLLHYHKGIRLESGGVVRAVLDLCGAMAAAGEDVVLASGDVTDVPESWRAGGDGLPRVVDAGPTAPPGARLTAASRRALEPLVAEADVVHLHGMWGFHAAQIATLCRRTGTPWILSVHGMLDDWCMDQKSPKKRLYLALAGRRLLEEAAAVHCTAGFELEQSRRWFPQGRGVVVPLIMDLEPYRALPGPDAARRAIPRLAEADVVEHGRPVLLFLSRLHHKKGVERLLEAVAAMDDARTRPLVVVAGTGDEAYARRLRECTRTLGLEDDVLFPGFVGGVEKVSLFQAADVFVLPTSQENFGFVIFEALAAATPVLTTKGADTWPEVEGSGGGVATEIDASAIRAALESLLDDPERRAAMGAAGRAWALEHLEADAVVARYRALYAEAAA